MFRSLLIKFPAAIPHFAKLYRFVQNETHCNIPTSASKLPGQKYLIGRDFLFVRRLLSYFRLLNFLVRHD